MTALLMPEPEAARLAGITEDYPTYRRWWARRVLKLKVRKPDGPEPATLDVEDPELG